MVALTILLYKYNNEWWLWVCVFNINTLTTTFVYFSETRWSARLDAVKPFAANLHSILSALTTLTKKEFPSLTAAVIGEIDGLKKYLTSYTCVLLSSIWFKVLKMIDIRNKLLQVF